jgi:hypothetical protein
MGGLKERGMLALGAELDEIFRKFGTWQQPDAAGHLTKNSNQ